MLPVEDFQLPPQYDSVDEALTVLTIDQALDKLPSIGRGITVGVLHAEDASTGQGEVTMGLLFDPPGHVRLPINDDEIIDRAVAVQTLAGREVTLLTYDTGMSTRARNAGLKVVKPTEAIGPEPTEAESSGRRGGS